MDPRHGDKTFPVLGDPPFPEECMETARREAREAGIPREAISYTAREVEVLVKGSDAERMASAGVYIPAAIAQAPKEWVKVYIVKAEAFGWKFHRSWYYWVCSTKHCPLPLQAAAEIHESHGQQVRVDGNCGCPEPKKDVMSYHVDTPEGLAVLVRALREQYEQREADRRRRYDEEVVR